MANYVYERTVHSDGALATEIGMPKSCQHAPRTLRRPIAAVQTAIGFRISTGAVGGRPLGELLSSYMEPHVRSLVSAMVFFGVTGPSFAQGLECKTITAQRAVNMGAVVEISVDVSRVDMDRGYVVTGGGCDFNGPTPDNHGLIIWSKPVANGYSCKARAPGDNTALTATVFATLCRVMPRQGRDVRRRAPFSNIGLGGGTVAVVRSERGAVPFSVRACNRSGGVPMEFDLTATQRVRVPLGDCLEVDKPQRLFFRTPTSVEIDEHGVYELFKSGTFAAKPKVGRPTPVGEAKRVAITQAMKEAVSSCRKPAPGEPFDTKSYWGYCRLDALKAGTSYRVCFDDGFTNQGKKLEYPGSLLPVVLDKALMARPNPGQLDSYLYMGIEPGGCRDLNALTDAHVLITDNSWNGQSVESLNYRYIEIPAVQ